MDFPTSTEVTSEGTRSGIAIVYLRRKTVTVVEGVVEPAPTG